MLRSTKKQSNIGMPQNCDSNFTEFTNVESFDETDTARLNSSIEKFEEIVGYSPDYLLLSPGRVNIIGDHVDYHGFDVLPMAIEKSISVACRIVDDQKNQLRIHNVDSTRHPSWTGVHSFKYGADLHKSHEWQNYILCGYHGVLAEQILQTNPSDVFSFSQTLCENQPQLASADQQLQNLKSLDIVVESDLPEASGLSSSSALVCASAMATLLLLQHSTSDGDSNSIASIDRRKLASSCAKYEHLIGTQGGGMDQAVILNAQKGYAKHIQFTPVLKCWDVCLPENVVWLVAHSGVRCPKAASSGFNSRVLETRLGAAMIAKALGNAALDDNRTMTLRQVKDKFLAGKTVEEIIDLLRRMVFRDKDCFTIDEVCSILEITRKELIARFNTSDDFLTKCLDNEVHLLSRCEHVFEEADRVEKFSIGSCVDGADVTSLGRAMYNSHRSLREKYDCSHPELDKIVEIALSAGAAGARLTGAGWGGCAIVMTTIQNSSAVADKLKDNCEFLFKTEPQSGCRIVRLHSHVANKQK